MNKIQAPVTLIAVLLRVTKGWNVQHSIYHGLAYEKDVEDSDGIKKYAEALAEKMFIKEHLDKDKANIVQHYAIVEYGVVAPDSIDLPIDGFTPDPAYAHMRSMEMTFMSQENNVPLIDIDLYPDIKEVK